MIITTGVVYGDYDNYNRLVFMVPDSQYNVAGSTKRGWYLSLAEKGDELASNGR